MAELKAIKISKETYAKLNQIAGELQTRMKRPVSIEEAMKYLMKEKEKGKKITDLAGSWNITDKELKQIKTSISEAWKTWTPPEL
jgi:predicted  nucleic acid-binding Zn-ribbon protein